MTSLLASEFLRNDLLSQVLAQGVVPVKQSWALKWIFPDVSIRTWCEQHGLDVEIETLWVDKRKYDGGFFSDQIGQTYVFLCFMKKEEKINLDEL